MARRKSQPLPPTPTRPAGQLTPEAVRKLRQVIDRCDHCHETWIAPGLAAGLPFHDAAAHFAGAKEMAQRILASYQLPVDGSGVS